MIAEADLLTQPAKKEDIFMADKTKEKETKTITPRRPFMGLTGWERDMDRMLEDFFGRRTRPWWPERWFKPMKWS